MQKAGHNQVVLSQTLQGALVGIISALLAMWFQKDISPGQPDWDISHPAWDRLTSVGISLGLTSGSTWRTFKDYPHFQLTGRFPVNPDDEVRTLFRDGGIMAVWQESQILEQNFSEAT